MVQKTDPFIGSNYGWDNGENAWGEGMNENLLQFSFLHNRRINGVVASLPGSPSDGDAYFLTTDSRVYFRADGVWYNSAVPVGTSFILKSNETEYKYDGTNLLSIENKQHLTRDIAALSSAAFSLNALSDSVMIKKLRTDYPEFCVYTPLSPDGFEWHRWLFTNRFNVGNAGSPRMINCSLAKLYSSTGVAHVASNKSSGTTASSTTNTYASSTSTNTGTWTAPATVSGVTDVSYSTNVGDHRVYTTTGDQRIVMRGLNAAGNGGIAQIKIFTDVGLTTEISESNYQIPLDTVTGRRIVSFASSSEGLIHVPLANGLTSGSTYYVQILVDASNGAGKRVYQAGLLAYNEIAYNNTGIHGVVDDAELPGSSGQINSRSYQSGTTAVYQVTNATKIKWRYVETTSGSIVQFKVYDNGGVEISSYDASSIDTYGSSSVSKTVSIASDLTQGTYFVHVINGKTRNVSNTIGYRYYDYGLIYYNENEVGVVGTDEFDDLDMPNIDSDPNNGTDYMLIGAGNLELAIGVRKTTEAAGDEEFVGGIHGFETTPTPVFTVDGAVINYAAAAQFATFVGNEVIIDFTTTLKFYIDSTDFCTVDYTYVLTKAGYCVKTTKTTLADSYIHNDYAIMFNCPNTDASTQGELVGGGFKHICADKNYVIDSFDNSGTFIDGLQKGAAFVNNKYMAVVYYVEEPELPDLLKAYPYVQGYPWSLIQDRTDRTVKFYTRAFSGNDTTGILVPSGTTWSGAKVYRCAKGNYKSLFGVTS